MRAVPTLWKANAIAFLSSFCVMVIELIAARIMAPYIGVSLYTWTSIIGVILAGIALGNYLGGRLADRQPSPVVLSAIFFVGGLLTILILPATRLVTTANWFGSLPIMWDFVLKTSCIFFLPAVVLSMVSPMVIKLTLADVGQTGGVVGTIYAFSTAGSILGTFMTGFLFISWFGTRTIVWLVAAVLILIGIIVWFSWKVPGRWRLSLRNFLFWTMIIWVMLAFGLLFQFRAAWQPNITKESNYYTIRVERFGVDIKRVRLDDLFHSYINMKDPTDLIYNYTKVFAEVVKYFASEQPAPHVLHLGGGGYAFPRYLEAVYPGSVNEVVEIDPAVTMVAHAELGLPQDTKIKTYNLDARLFLMQRQSGAKYDFVIGDVFNDKATPYHLATQEFDQLIKANMSADGIYLVNIIDDYRRGRYLPSFIYTLKHVFKYVYLFTAGEDWEQVTFNSFIIAATDRPINLADYQLAVRAEGSFRPFGSPHDEAKLEEYLAARKPVLLTDDYVPTDVLIAAILRKVTP